MKHALLGLALVGCAGVAPPDSVHIDPGFSEDERATIRDALGAWCDAVGWCPTEAPDGAPIELVATLTPDDLECPRGACAVGGINTGEGLQVAQDAQLTLDRLWMIIAHEAGHFCNPRHAAHGLMAYYHEGAVLKVDSEAVALWHEGCP